MSGGMGIYCGMELCGGERQDGAELCGGERHGGCIYAYPGVRLDFSASINPLGMPEFARRAAVESLKDCGRYPDSECRSLRAAAAEYYGIGGERLVFGNGAAELIWRLAAALRPRRAVLTAPSFSEYEAALAAAGTELLFFRLKEENGFELPVGEYLDFLKEAELGPSDVIFLCNPANPAGTVLSRGETDAVLDYCAERRVLAVVDECFIDFLEKPEEATVLDRAKTGGRPLFVLGALTKSFAMAGLRFGFGIAGDPALAGKLARFGQPWSVSIPAQAAAEAVFRGGAMTADYLLRTAELIRTEKKRLAAGLAGAGFQVYSSAANYLFFRCPKEDAGLAGYFLENGVLIRSCGGFYGLDGAFFRIAVRLPAENGEFLGLLRNYVKNRRFPVAKKR